MAAILFRLQCVNTYRWGRNLSCLYTRVWFITVYLDGITDAPARSE